MRRSFVSCGFALAAALVAACSQPAGQPAKLAPVDALPRPSLPPWIASVSPTGSDAQSLAQVRVIFNKPVTAVTSLSGAGPAEVLAHVSMDPALKGHFVVLTPRMIGFVAEQALPVGTRVRVTVTSGLRDLDGDTLDRDIAWTFQTQALSFTDLPQLQASPDAESSPAPVGTRPALTIGGNAAADLASLAAHTTLQGGGDTVPVDVTVPAEPTPYPGSDASERFDPALKDWTYRITPQHDLRPSTTYTLRIAPGVEPAYGNMPTDKAYAGGVHVYDPLAVVPTPKPSPGGLETRFANGDPVVAFNNPLDSKSIAGQVTVSPAPVQVSKLAVLSDDGTSIAIDPYALDPDRDYTVTIGGDVKDTFGQRLGSAQTIAVHTGDFTPGFWVPSGTNVIPAGLDVALNFYATNLPDNAYRSAFARVDAQTMLQSADANSVLPSPSSQWPSSTLAGAVKNRQSVVTVPLRERLGGSFGSLAYGFTTSLDAPGTTGIVQLTNLGIFAQWFPQHGMVLVQHLSDGAPAAGVAVAVYRNVGSDATGAPVACANGTTSATGEADFQGVDLERCYAGSSADNAPSLGVTASEGADLATLLTSSYAGIYRFNVYGGWSAGTPLSRGTIATDRQMYQPGERGEITGFAYYVSGDRIVADKNASYAVKLVDPNNHETPLGSVTTDAYGVFSLPIAFSAQQALGYYTIAATGTSGNKIDGSLRVAEFKPPNFKLALSLSADSATAGSSVKASATAAYLFGAPLQGGTAHAYVTRDVASLSPKGWDEFWFGPQWFWPQQTPSFDTDVLQRDLPLDSAGATSLDVTVPADLPFPMTYRVDMETTDVSNLSVSDSQSFTALPGDGIVGLASDVVGAAGKPMPVRVIVTDVAGKALPGRAVHLELQKMTYTAASQAVEGGESADRAIQYDTVATADTTSADQPVAVNLTPADAGPYRVRATLNGAAATATDMQVFAFGAGEADWGQNDQNAVPVKLDKKKYAVGQTATALIASPFAKADVYFAVVRGDTIYRTVVHGAAGATKVSFPITQNMLPNAAVEAVVVRRGAPLTAKSSELTKGALDTLSRTGMAAFDVDVSDRYLQLAIAPQQATVKPGGPQRVSFTLKGHGGAPASGEIVAMVVNDAILQLSGYRLPDLVTTVYAQQPISTTFSDSRDNVVLKTQTAPVEKGFGYGGGYLAGAAGTRVRSNFLPLAYYGTVRTDASGKATVSFTMPDDLTTWRVMAVGVGGDDAHFATSDATFVSTQPLIANPLLPQFARPGDTFDGGVSIANQTGSGGALDLAIALTGALLVPSDTARAIHATPQASTGVQAFRYAITAGTPAPSTVAATAKLGDVSDAFSVPFAIVNAASTDSVIDSGVTKAGTASIPVAFDRGGWVHLTLANSVVPQFVVPSNKAMSQEGLPLADESISRLVIASAVAPLRVPYHLALDFDPAAVAAANLQRLYGFQRGDGGLVEYAAAKQDDPFVSAYALDALAFARAHGVAVRDGARTNLASFVSRSLADPSRFGWCGSALCKAQLRFESLWALAAAGDRRTDFLGDVVAQSAQFDSATQIRLARYLLATPGWHDKGAAMADHLMQTLYLTGRYATANVSSQWSFFGSVAQAQAQMLQLLVERNAPADQRDGAVRALVQQQCRCGWPTMDDNAEAMRALSAYAATETLRPGSVTATAGGSTVATAQFGSTAASQNFTIAAPALKGNAIVLRSSGSDVHYTLLYTYDVPSDAPGELSAFRVTRTVAAPGATSPPLATMDLAPAQPLEVGAGKVFDVGVRVVVDHPVDGLVIEDPLPAGFEAVDTTFRTTLQAIVPQSDSWDIGSQQIYRDRVVAYAEHLGPGVYEMHYLARSVTPGTFRWPGTRAYLHAAPEQFGRSAASALRVTQ